MPYRLNKGVYSVRCRHPRCTFNTQLEIKDNIMGMTESDVEEEARKVVWDMAHVKHDSMHGRQHTLQRPEIHMASGNIQLTGAGPIHESLRQKETVVKEFMKGEVILKEGDEALSVCEVLRGTAFPRRNRRHRYMMGDCFGVAALLPHHSRMTDVVAGSDGTKIGFYRLNDLTRKDPKKANQVLTRVLEDTIKVLGELEQRAPA